jgi:basic amino acid/polyamine antiporter, APA family
VTGQTLAPSTRGLQRILGLGFGLAVTVGSTIGVGILRTPGLVAAQLVTPTLILFTWIVGGLYTLLGVACLAELGTMMPAAGGYYVYARRAFGVNAGFAVGWTDWITYCAVLGYISIGLAEFTAVLVPALAPWSTAIAIAALVGLVALQWGGVRISGRFQEVATALKFAAFLALVIACLAFSGASPAAAAAATPRAGVEVQTVVSWSLAAFVIALQSVIITYGGWQSALYFTEEDRDPSRHLPRAMIGGVASVIVVYVLVNVALLEVLPADALAKSTLPAADAAQIVLGDRGRQAITILSIVSLAPLLNAIMMIGTRILFALGRDRLLPSQVAVVNAGGTPIVATLVTTAVAVALIATGTFQRLVAVASFLLAVNYFVCCVALLVLRHREPDAARPFRAWGHPWSTVIVALGAGAFVIGAVTADTRSAVLALVLVAAGSIGQALVRRRG